MMIDLEFARFVLVIAGTGQYDETMLDRLVRQHGTANGREPTRSVLSTHPDAMP